MKAIIINEYGDESVVISTDVERPIPRARKGYFSQKPESRKIK
ncbi:MAG: hypothetical protein ABR566_09965 [Pyrinomonadaceae bacterium]